jgi:hypothetical protein
MKIYKTQSEVEADIKNGVLAIKGDVKFECDISIRASIVVTGGNITARDITARNITARDITARNITARNITARDISYYAFCTAYQGIKCTKIEASRYNAHEPICLDGKLEIIKKEDDEVERAIKLLEEKGKLKDGKILI